MKFFMSGATFFEFMVGAMNRVFDVVYTVVLFGQRIKCVVGDEVEVLRHKRRGRESIRKCVEAIESSSGGQLC